MIGHIDEKLTHFIVKTGFLKKENNVTEEILLFGCNIFLDTIISWGILLMIAEGRKRLSEAIVYILVFSLLKGYAGGYHAPNALWCKGTYVGLFCVSNLLEYKLINTISTLELITIGMGVLSCFIVPIGTIDNPIPQSYKASRRKKLFIIICMIIFLYNFIFKLLYQYYVLSAVFWCEILLFIGKGKNYVKKKGRNIKK